MAGYSSISLVADNKLLAISYLVAEASHWVFPRIRCCTLAYLPIMKPFVGSLL
jgi:hypothetical protein